MDLVNTGTAVRYQEHCSLGEARDLLLEKFAPLGRVIRLSPEEALGSRLAADTTSRRNVPHYTASAVDGYALSAAETAGATQATPVVLEKDRCTWVNTGMPVGEWDAVIMIEDTSESTDGIVLFRSLTQGENVRAVGEDVMNGQLLAYEGDRVTPALVSLLLCAGVESVPVYDRPKTLFIPTGNEIVEKTAWLADAAIPAGMVVDSNSEYARALFAAWGYPLNVNAILPDDSELIRETVRDALEKYDLVLVSAGSAKGKRDHSADVFTELGEMIFRYVRMKPGRPAMAADISGKPVVCTPGFPMSCTVTLWSLVYPLLLTLAGEPLPDDILSSAMGAQGIEESAFMVQHSSPPGVAEWLRLKMADVRGTRYCWPLSAGASVLWALAECDGIALLPEQNLENAKGAPVPVRMLRRPPFSRRLLFQGSDDPAIQLLVSFVRRRNADFAIRAVGSMGGLAALSRDEAHFAAAHLLDPEDGSYNPSYIERFAAGRRWARKLVFHRQQGIIVARGNPRGIRDVADLAGGEIVLENRQPGAGTRVLLDYMLAEQGFLPSTVKGYGRQSITHMEAANKVASGVADATLGIKAAADALGLDFIPIAEEPYELVFTEDFEEHPAAPSLYEALDDPGWIEAVSRMGGYRWPE